MTNELGKSQQVIIVGGGTAGWMTAAALGKFLDNKKYTITLIESEAIGTVGVGEATVPHIRFFNERLGINENEFMQKTNATYKLGIEFSNWAKRGDAYIHPFGVFGKSFNDVSFHHYWLRAKKLGNKFPIGDYSLGIMAGYAGKFDYPNSDVNSLSSKYSYAFHFDASLYATFLRNFSESHGVIRKEGKIIGVQQSTDTGFVQSLTLDSGEIVNGNLFIDCSGFRGLLIEQTLKTGYEDWSHWLPCDRAIAVPTERTSDPLPYTKAIARDAGWQWRIPLQSRTGNGQVYSSRYISDEAVEKSLLENLDGKPLANLNHIRFQTGRRKKSWNKNCVAIGLSSGFLEPLESTSIYLIQIAIVKLIEYFPDADFDSLLSDEFNREIAMEYERVRDFLILHYSATEREDTEFWRYVKNMAIPESLQYKIDLFRHQGYVEHYKRGMFLEPSWVAVYLGQNIIPENYHPSVNKLSDHELLQQLNAIHNQISVLTENMPTHMQSINKNCKLGSDSPSIWPPAAMNLYGVFS